MFFFKKATTEEEKIEIYKLRYQVYCEEYGFLPAADHPDGLEKDEYDDFSTHFTATDNQGNIIGTIRLIQDSKLGLPIEKYCGLKIDNSINSRENIAEISRLAINKIYRNRVNDYYCGFSLAENDVDKHQENISVHRHRLPIFLGLYKVMYRESKWMGVIQWYAVMESFLNHILMRYNFEFFQVGQAVNYHGVRIPYSIYISQVERDLAQRKPDLFRFFTDWKRVQTYEL